MVVGYKVHLQQMVGHHLMVHHQLVQIICGYGPIVIMVKVLIFNIHLIKIKIIVWKVLYILMLQVINLQIHQQLLIYI